MSREDEIRTLEQNKKLHAMIRDISRQVEWAGAFMDEKEWKLLVMGAAHGQKVVPNPLNPQGAFVVVNNRRSSGLNVPTMADLITELQVFGDERGIEWSDPALEAPHGGNVRRLRA